MEGTHGGEIVDGKTSEGVGPVVNECVSKGKEGGNVNLGNEGDMKDYDMDASQFSLLLQKIRDGKRLQPLL